MAHGLLYLSTLGSRVIKKKRRLATNKNPAMQAGASACRSHDAATTPSREGSTRAALERTGTYKTAKALVSR